MNEQIPPKCTKTVSDVFETKTNYRYYRNAVRIVNT